MLITNGVLLHKAPPELWALIDQLWISAYPGIKRKLDDEECGRICEAHGVRLKITDYQTFQKTVINNRINDPELVNVIFRDCKNAGEWSCHTVYDGRFYKCSVAPFMSARLALRGVAFDNIPVDGVALHDNANLYEEVDRCLNGPTPLAACAYCLGSSGPSVAHHQLNRIGRSRWLEEDHSSDIEAVRLVSLRAKEGDDQPSASHLRATKR